MAHPVAEGDILADKYRVERVLGKGGMGLVVAAMHLQLKERVALKFLLPAAAQQAEFAARFQREAQLMAKLRGEHVVRITDVGVLATGAPYMVMEHLEGTDLREIIRQVRPVPLDVALDYILQACEGVAEAHSFGIVHRDLKPTNLFVTQRRDGSPLVKVLDFGISKALDDDEDEDDQLTGAATILGSPKYMPPEQLRSSRNVDARADVWALGAIFQEMLTGDPPFSGPNTTAICAAVVGDPPVPLRRARPDLPESLEAVLLRCFEKEPEARWPNVAELASELVKAAAPDDAEMNLAVDRIMRLSSPNSSLLSTTGGRRALSRSGQSAALSRTGSNPTPISLPPTSRPSTSVTPLAPPSDDASGGVPVSAGPVTQGGSRRNRLLIGAAVVAALALGGFTLARSKGDEPRAAQAAVVTASSPAAPATPAASEPRAEPAGQPASAAAPPTPAPSASVDPAPADTSSRAAKHGDRPSPKEGSSRGKGSGDSGSKASPATAAPTPTQAPSPTATPAPPPKEKPLGNPLEDRQ